MRSGSIALFGMYGSVSDLVSIDLANAILFLSFGVTWTGARVFDHRAPLPAYILVGPLMWFFVSHVPTFTVNLDLRILLSCSIIASYTWLSAYEFWRGRSEPLVSRWPAIFMLFAHGSLFLLRTPLAGMLPWLPAGSVVGSVWLIVMTFEALLFTISIAFILLAMAKERAEFRLRTAAMVDSLTGIANRRAFLQDGAALAKRHAANPCSVAVLLIDLDHLTTGSVTRSATTSCRSSPGPHRRISKRQISSADWAARNSRSCSMTWARSGRWRVPSSFARPSPKPPTRSTAIRSLPP